MYILKVKVFAWSALFFITTLSIVADTRSWTAKDGRVIQGEYLSATTDSVDVRRSDGVSVTIPFKMLSDADVAWVNRQPKPVVVTVEQLNQLIAKFPRTPALSNGETTNDLRQLHDKYESMVKFIRTGTIEANLKMIRGKIADDSKILRQVAGTTPGDHTGKRGSLQSQGAENAILSARRSLSWLEDVLATYLVEFDELLAGKK